MEQYFLGHMTVLMRFARSNTRSGKGLSRSRHRKVQSLIPLLPSLLAIGYWLSVVHLWAAIDLLTRPALLINVARTLFCRPSSSLFWSTYRRHSAEREERRGIKVDILGGQLIKLQQNLYVWVETQHKPMISMCNEISGVLRVEIFTLSWESSREFVFHVVYKML